MSIFNSLGSNYNASFVFKSLFAGNDLKSRKELENFLENKYSGKVVLTYKGREAIALALKIADLNKNSKIAITGFTCWAVYNAVKRAGFSPEFLDIDLHSLNFPSENLRNALKTRADIRAVIVQNTLGYPCQMEEIKKICHEAGILLVEDLAHCVGTLYDRGLEAGTVGDFTILSFSQDKVVDSISGGALIIRNKKYQNFYVELDDLDKWHRITDRFYPLFTFFIRKTYDFGLGKGIHFLLKKFNLLSKPVAENSSDGSELPSWYCRLALIALNNLKADLAHRKKIAAIYAEELNSIITSEEISKKIPLSSNLRFPIFVKNRNDLVEFLKIKNIYVSDIWYDAPVAPKRFLSKTTYNRQCPNAEKIAEEILNLPTHKNVSEKDAYHISEEINQWQKLQ